MPPAPAPARKPGQLVPDGAVIASAALRYRGAGYTFGGRADRPGNWDCSSFVSYVLGHDLGLTLPGGGRYGAAAYPPHYHGPVVTSYYGWAGATRVAAPAAGDLCIWNGAGPLGHIGIAVDAHTMISAQDAALGTNTSGIPASLHGAPLTVHRINGAGQLPGASGSGSAGDLLAAALFGASVPAVMVLVLFGAAVIVAAVATAAAVAGAAYIASRE